MQIILYMNRSPGMLYVILLAYNGTLSLNIQKMHYSLSVKWRSHEFSMGDYGGSRG